MVTKEHPGLSPESFSSRALPGLTTEGGSTSDTRGGVKFAGGGEMGALVLPIIESRSGWCMIDGWGCGCMNLFSEFTADAGVEEAPWPESGTF